MTTNRHESVDRFARYAQHICELCSAFCVRMLLKDMAPDLAAAGHLHSDPNDKCIVIARVIDDTTYAVALHELGHCVHPLGMLYLECSKTMRTKQQLATSRDVRLQLLSEQSAWEWAHHYALEWTEAMTFVERSSMKSYTDNARRLLGREVK